MSSVFSAGLLGASFVAGSVGSVAGFGIGSLLTPLLATRTGLKLAVAAVSIPHFAAAALRLWLMREHVDRRVLLSFGVMSAAGGLCGALLHGKLGGPVLTLVFGVLLTFAGLMTLTGLSRKLRFSGAAAWAAGLLSGLFGGLVGNQGGIRSAAMLGFDVPKEAFVATATAAGVIVDLARMPVYAATEASGLASLGSAIALMTAGTLSGTILGARLLRRVPETAFRRLIGLLILALGMYEVMTVVG